MHDQRVVGEPGGPVVQHHLPMCHEPDVTHPDHVLDGALTVTTAAWSATRNGGGEVAGIIGAR
jgi:hypothetical protein